MEIRYLTKGMKVWFGGEAEIIGMSQKPAGATFHDGEATRPVEHWYLHVCPLERLIIDLSYEGAADRWAVGDQIAGIEGTDYLPDADTRCGICGEAVESPDDLADVEVEETAAVIRADPNESSAASYVTVEVCIGCAANPDAAVREARQL